MYFDFGISNVLKSKIPELISKNENHKINLFIFSKKWWWYRDQTSISESRWNLFDIQKNHIEAKKLIGYIPDQPFLYDKLTGKEFLYFCGGIYKIENGIGVEVSDHDLVKDNIVVNIFSYKNKLKTRKKKLGDL